MRRIIVSIALLVPAIAGAQGVGHFAPSQYIVPQSTISMEIGRCVVKRDRRKSISLVMATNSSAITQATKELNADMVACLGSKHSATLDVVHMRGAMAEALLNEDGGAPLARAAAMSAVAPERVAPGESASYASIGCAVAANPPAAAELLRAPAESPDEMAAFRKLAPSLQACVPATGSVTIKPFIVRATVAASTYRRLTGTN